MSQSLFKAHKFLDKVQIFSQKIMTLMQVFRLSFARALKEGFFFAKIV